MTISRWRGGHRDAPIARELRLAADLSGNAERRQWFVETGREAGFRAREIVGDDRLGVMGRVLADVIERVIRVVDDPHGDIEVRAVGLRPGEKLYEELLIDEKRTMPTEHPRIRRNNEPSLAAAVLERELAKLEAAMQLETGSLAAIHEVLARTVEGYTPQAADTETFTPPATWTPPGRTLH